MRRRFDGSIQTGALPSYQNSFPREDHALYRCMVTKVKYVDDPDNITTNAENPEVLYDVVVLGGFQAGQVIANCRLSNQLSGNLNFDERVLKASTKKIETTRLQDQDGDIVYVQFVQGHSAYPVITALDKGTQTKDVIGATKSDGHRWRRQYNGIFEEIDKNGNYLWKKFTGEFQSDIDEFIPTEEVDYELTLDNQEKITETFKSGLKVTKDGVGDSVEILTAAGVKILIDGASDLVEIKDSGSGTMKITGNTIAIGADGTELLQQISDSLDKLLNWANSVGAAHVHVGNLGYPTAVPTQAAQYTQLGTDLQAIKDKVDGIKGSL